MAGDAYSACRRNSLRCSSSAACGRDAECEGGFCLSKCRSTGDCACGELCSEDGLCRSTCLTSNDCQNGAECADGACVAGCRLNDDCQGDEACSNGKCVNPCDLSLCDQHSTCRVSDHKPLCFCDKGYQRTNGGNGECVKAECSSDRECNRDKKCVDARCVNPCTFPDTCGKNAECRMQVSSERKKQQLLNGI